MKVNGTTLHVRAGGTGRSGRDAPRFCRHGDMRAPLAAAMISKRSR
jgi:hypothetical protein